MRTFHIVDLAIHCAFTGLSSLSTARIVLVIDSHRAVNCNRIMQMRNIRVHFRTEGRGQIDVTNFRRVDLHMLKLTFLADPHSLTGFVTAYSCSTLPYFMPAQNDKLPCTQDGSFMLDILLLLMANYIQVNMRRPLRVSSAEPHHRYHETLRGNILTK